jgi:pimeloyl-ACP methyl ester carboxylesterase
MSPILRGGVADARNISPELMADLYRTGNRPWHYRAFISLIRNAASWEHAQDVYAGVNVPALLIWGDQDWSRGAERARTRALIPKAVTKTIADAGHFLPLDQPRQLLELIVNFASAAA